MTHPAGEHGFVSDAGRIGHCQRRSPPGYIKPGGLAITDAVTTEMGVFFKLKKKLLF
jgi:hypothetical protein